MQKQDIKRALHTSDYTVAKAKVWKILEKLEVQFNGDAEDNVAYSCRPPWFASRINAVDTYLVSMRKNVTQRLNKFHNRFSDLAKKQLPIQTIEI